MIPTFIEIENVLKTLPVGYYIGRNVPLTLTNEESSYYVPMDDKAFISYPMLKNVMAKVETKLNNENIEKFTRTLTYHEISHAFITPTTLTMNNVINVFEDERIETICKNYYTGVNFKELLMFVNDWDGKTEPIHTTPFSVWYSIVRYHMGKQEFVVRAAQILKRYQKLNRCSSYYTVKDYVYEITDLYNDVVEDFMKDIEENSKTDEHFDDALSNDDNNDEYDNSDNDANNNDNDDGDNDETTSTAKDEGDIETSLDDATLEHLKKQTEAIFENITSIDIDEVKQLFEKAQTFVNNDIHTKLSNIILTHKKIAKSNATAINAYSGVFNPMSVVRDDYKWFVQQNRQGNVKQFSKIKLNLFIDISGSFSNNEHVANQILFALNKLEQTDPNFKFDLITMNTQFKLKSRNEREIKCFGGNDIPDYANDIIKKVQDRQSMNYNIVLFDGDALTNNCSSNKARRFEFFNIQNTVMILDYSNSEYANEYCKNVKRIYTDRYTEELIDQICVALNFLFK